MLPAQTPTWNATEINARFVLGGGITGDDEMRWLAEQRVTHVISVARELDDTALCVPDEMGFFHLDWDDDAQPKPLQDFLDLLDYAVDEDNQWLRESQTTLPRYYLHCAAGVNRGPMACVFLFAAVSGQSADEVWTLIKAQRPQVNGYQVPAYKQSVDAALAAVRGVEQPHG